MAVIIGPFRVTVDTGSGAVSETEKRRITEAWAHCTYPMGALGGEIELLLTSRLADVPGTNTKAWGWAVGGSLIKVNRYQLTRRQFEYAIIHELGHAIDYRKNTKADHASLDALLSPDFGYVEADGTGWSRPTSSSLYRRRASECYAHEFTRVYAAPGAPWLETGSIVLPDYYARKIATGEYASYKGITENGTGDGSGGDSPSPDDGHAFVDSITFQVAKDLSRRRKPNVSKQGSGGEQHLPMGLIGEHIYSALMKFDLSWPTEVEVVTQAELNLTLTAHNTSHITASGPKANLIAHKVLADWPEGNNGEGVYDASDWQDPLWATTAHSLGPVEAGPRGTPADFDLMHFIHRWAPSRIRVQGRGAGIGDANHGLFLKMAVTDKIEGATEFGSSENPTTEYRPTIYVQFEPTAASPIAIPHFPSGSVNTTDFVFEGSYGDPLAKDNLGAYDLQVRRKSNQNSIWFPPTQAADANEASTGVFYVHANRAPAGTWKAGIAYEWRHRVQSQGSKKWSDWTDWEEFTITNLPPTVTATSLGSKATLDNVFFGGPYVDPDETISQTIQKPPPLGFARMSMWLTFWRNHSVATLTSIATQMKDMNISGVIVQGMDWGPTDQLPADVSAKLDIFKSRGMKVYLGLWLAEFTTAERDMATQAWADGQGKWDGVIYDVESAWKVYHAANPATAESRAVTLTNALRAAGANFIALSSYGVPQFHTAMDWEFWNGIMDAHLPQIYFSNDDTLTTADQYLNRAWNGWAKVSEGWSVGLKPMIPVVNAHGANADAVQRKAYAERVLREQGAISWWRWALDNAEVRNVLRGITYNPPPPIPREGTVLNARIQMRSEPANDPSWAGDVGFLWDTQEVPLTADETSSKSIRREYTGSRLEPGTYTYRVQVQDRAGAWSGWSYGTVTLTVAYEPSPVPGDYMTSYGRQRKSRVVIYDMGANRGPNAVKAIIYDHLNAGASMVANDIGEFYMTLPTTHAQASEIEPLQRHYSWQFWRNGQWKPVFTGVIVDMDADENEVVFYGLDYMGLLSKSIETVEQDWDNPEQSFDLGGDKYLDKTISFIIKDQLTRAKAQADSPLGFINVEGQGAGTLMEPLSEKVSLHVAYKERLSLILGLIQSSKQGTGRRTRLWPERIADGTWRWRLRVNAGQDRDNLRLKYGELVQGFRVVVMGDWASKVYGIGRVTNQTKVRFKNATAPGIDTAIWGSMGMVGVWQDLVDENDLARRVKQLAIEMGKLGKNVALGLRVHGLQVLDGYDICDNIPVEIVRGAVDTTRYGSGYWTLWGVEYREFPDGHDEVNLALKPREDQTAPDPDLIPSRPVSTASEWVRNGLIGTGLVATSNVVIRNDGTSAPTLEVTWDELNQTNFGFWTMQLATNGTGDFTDAITVTSEQAKVIIENVTPDQDYSLRVGAFDASGAFSGFAGTTVIRASTDITAPSTPTNLNVLPAYRGLLIIWDGSPEMDTSHYVVSYQPTEDVGGPIGPVLVATAGTAVAITGLDAQPGESYAYSVRVAAVDRSGNQSVFTAPVIATPLLITGPDVEPDTIDTTHLRAQAVTAQKLYSGLIEANKVQAANIAAGAIDATHIQAGSIDSGHIVAEGLDADVITTGTLAIGGAGSPPVLVVYNAAGVEIGRFDSTGGLFKDPNDFNRQMRWRDGTLSFSGNGGVTWSTAINADGIDARAIRVGHVPGGNNLIPNASFEMTAFVSLLSKVWTTTADFSGTTGTVINVTAASDSLSTTVNS